MAKSKIKLSTLGKTWILDLDGTLVKHNGHLTKEGDSLLPGVSDFFSNSIKKQDYVIITTARHKKYKEKTIEYLEENNIQFDRIIFSMPPGERIIINDTKPKGLRTAISIPVVRDIGLRDIVISQMVDK